MRVGVVGAGVSGLVTARVLSAAGHDVTVFERSAELGGVWSAGRRYPDLSTQDDRAGYAYSDFPMPEGVALHPDGAEVAAYLEAYAAHHGLLRLIRRETEVVSAELDDGGWVVKTRGPAGPERERVGHLVAAHGAYSAPYVPVLARAERLRGRGRVGRRPLHARGRRRSRPASRRRRRVGQVGVRRRRRRLPSRVVGRPGRP